ncbi:LysM peptidoglycan-binding domain-containing protein [Williamsia sp. 1135]|uniref:LysM peptidoglycan-binding domain-containing protein n=1 Tax=Williamsia sp. 1135 TaxID=1889262 RepID=UPI00117E7C8A|nr:LysM peptidoglycan-binding domain-containing protein [Williamsia sp. 1135]
MTAATTISRPATSRPVRRLADSGAGTRTVRPVRPADTNRPADRRHGVGRRGVVTCGESDNAAQRQATSPMSVYARRRAWAAAAVAGVGLMVLVVFMMFFGGVVEQSANPANTGTAVVHVQSGESLGDIASRIAPEMPTAAVVDKIMELNAMNNSALSVGQSLLTPVYAR